MSPPADDGPGSDAGNRESADRSSVDPADAFGALSDPLRVDVLRALADHHRETGGADPVGFANLRRRVGVRDSGRFRYHLEELRDRFLEKTGDGYRLTYAGLEVVAAILAGTYTERVSMGPERLDSGCPTCDGPAVAVYERGICRVTCPENHSLFQWSVPPNATAGATLPEVVDLAETLARQAIELTIAGTCPRCYDPVDAAVAVDGERPALESVCDTCGGRVVGPAAFCLLVEPRVAAFHRRHGRSMRDRHVWELDFVREETATTVRDDDPVRIAFDVSLGNETLSVTVDETGETVAVHTEGESPLRELTDGK